MRTKTNLASLVLIAVAVTAAGITLTAAVANAQSSAASLSGTQWKGIYASGRQSNIPATLSIYSQNGSMMGTLTYDGYVETVAITANGPRALRLKGVSYKDTRGGRSFYLDNFSAEISADGHAINATGGDTNSAVASEWLRLQRSDLPASAAPPQPASPNLARSLIGSNWQGGIAESQKGATPAQLRIVQQGGGLNAILVYEQFEEILAVTLTAPSGIQMRGTAYRDLENQRRGFTLDTAQGEISRDGHTLIGTIGRLRFEFHRVN